MVSTAEGWQYQAGAVQGIRWRFSVFLNRLLQLSGSFLEKTRGFIQCFHRGSIHTQIDLARILLMDDIIAACIKGNRRCHRYDHNGGQDADAGKADSILFHAVKQTGYIDEMICLVIIAFSFFHHLQPCDASGGKQKVSSCDDQKDCNKKQRKCSKGICDLHRDSISEDQYDKSDDCEDPFCFRLLFPYIACTEQFNVGEK